MGCERRYAPQKTLHTVERGLVGGRALAPPLAEGWDEASDEMWYGGGMFTKWVVEARSNTWVN